jgi:hypothetical protein
MERRIVFFSVAIALLNLLVLVLAIAEVCHGTQCYEQVVERLEP